MAGKAVSYEVVGLWVRPQEPCDGRHSLYTFTGIWVDQFINIFTVLKFKFFHRGSHCSVIIQAVGQIVVEIVEMGVITVRTLLDRVEFSRCKKDQNVLCHVEVVSSQ